MVPLQLKDLLGLFVKKKQKKCSSFILFEEELIK